MLYNRHSFRLLVQAPFMLFLKILSRKNAYKTFGEQVRAIYDPNKDGNPAPHTDFVSAYGARRLFKRFSSVKIDVRNFGSYSFRNRVILNRDRFLNNLGRVWGLDLYVTAIK
jgi:hypothetical protein